MLHLILMSQLNQITNKILSVQNLLQQIDALKQQGKKIVFTNGCFDILHKGHVQYLSLAADKGDVLVVAINSDSSVKRQGKGDDRPVNNFDSRAFVLASLQMVNYVIEFNADTPLEIIEVIKPNVLVKGGDYDANESDKNSKKYIVGRDCVLNHGGKVETIDLVAGFSTTNIINKLKHDN